MINPIWLMRDSMCFKQQPKPQVKPKPKQSKQSTFAEVLAAELNKR